MNDPRERLRRLATKRATEHAKRQAPRALLEAAFPIPPRASSAAPALGYGLAAASVAAAPFLPIVRTEPMGEGAALVIREVAQALVEEAGQ